MAGSAQPTRNYKNQRTFQSQQKAIEKTEDHEADDGIVVSSSESSKSNDEAPIDEVPNAEKFKYSQQDLSSQSDSDQQSDKTDSAREEEMAYKQQEIEDANNMGNMKEPAYLDARKIFENMDSLPLMRSGYSLEADMRLGWRPQIKGKVLPIPLIFDEEDEYFELDHYVDFRNLKKGYNPTIY